MPEKGSSSVLLAAGALGACAVAQLLRADWLGPVERVVADIGGASLLGVSGALVATRYRAERRCELVLLAIGLLAASAALGLQSSLSTDGVSPRVAAMLSPASAARFPFASFVLSFVLLLHVQSVAETPGDRSSPLAARRACAAVFVGGLALLFALGPGVRELVPAALFALALWETLRNGASARRLLGRWLPLALAFGGSAQLCRFGLAWDPVRSLEGLAVLLEFGAHVCVFAGVVQHVQDAFMRLRHDADELVRSNAALATQVARTTQAQARQAAVNRLFQGLAVHGTATDHPETWLAALADVDDFDVATLWLPEPEGDGLRCAGYWQRPFFAPPELETTVRQSRCAPGEALVGRAWSSALPVFDPALERAAEPAPVPGAVAFGVRSGIAVALRAAGRQLGVLEVLSVRELTAPQELLELLQAMAGQVAEMLRRELAEAALRAEEARWRALLGSMPVGVFLAGAGGQLRFVNSAWSDIAGLAAADVLGRDWRELVHPDDRGPLLEARAVREAEHAVETRFRLLVDGGVRWVDARLLALPGAEIVGTLADITEQHDIADAVARSHQALEEIKLALDAHAIVSITDAAGDIVYVNDRFCQVHQYAREELLGANHRLVSSGRHPAAFWRELWQVLRAGGVWRGEICNRAKDGSPVWVETTIVPMLDTSGATQRYIAVRADVTDRKRMEQQLQATNLTLEATVGELELQNRTAGLLSETAELLQSCDAVTEAYEVLGSACRRLFPGLSGAVLLRNASHTYIEAGISWGSGPGQLVFPPNACWALRRARMHLVEPGGSTPACQHMLPQEDAAAICAPMLANGEAVGVVHLHGAPSGFWTPARRQSLSALTEQAGLALANLRLRETLSSQSIRDPLTGLFNRRYMQEALERELRRAERHDRPVSLIMFDVDHFKSFNDTFGHRTGDTVLERLGQVVRRFTRKDDVACRYGGEEFLLILPEASLDSALALAEKLRMEVVRMRPSPGEVDIEAVTISLGVASAPAHGWDPAVLVEAADHALYMAKHRGRNQVACFTLGLEEQFTEAHAGTSH